MPFMHPIQPWQLLLVSLAGWIDRVVSKYSHDPRCLLGSNGNRRTQLTCKLFDFLDRAGRDGLDLDDD